jgi:alkanesulfonate monooxygenase SsuD/methylene tetrahydromethanopterin reductase-like flavin-dependent oxidoreductase (luciferase family)
MNPPPARRARSPLLVGAYAERAVERAGRIGDGWIVPPELVGGALERRLERFRAAASSAATAGSVVLMRPFHVTTSDEERRTVEEALTRHFGRKRAWGLSKGKDDTSDPAADARAAAIVGTPDECVAKIEQVRRQIEPDHLILLMGFRGTGDAFIRSALELSGEQVVPALDR